MSVYCTGSGTCNHSFNNSEAPHPATEVLYQRNYTLSSPVGVGAVSQSTGFAEFTFTHPVMTPVTTAAAVAPVVRCDQLGGFRNTAGCIVAGAEPILDTTTRGVPAHAGHVGYAQSSGLPGAPNATPLTRTTDPALAQANRNATCNRIPGPRPSGQQCDEYPFASTYQGGGASPARTYQGTCEAGMPPWLTRLSVPVGYFDSAGVSMCTMASAQNLRAGGILSWFYTKNRVHDGDPFYVKGA